MRFDAPAPHAASAATVPVATPVAELGTRVSALEAELAHLREQVEALAEKVRRANGE